MIARPVLREDFAVYHLHGEGNILLSDTESFALEGGAITPVLSMIDGKRTRAEIVASLAGQVPAEDVSHTLDYLAQMGHLREADAQAAPEEALFWSSLGIDTRSARDRAAAYPISVIGLGKTNPEIAASWLGSMGLQIAPQGTEGAVALVLADDYLDPQLEPLNRHFQTKRMAWLLVRAAGLKPLVGPLFVPGTTGCWECLRTRLVENREVELLLSRRLGVAGPPERPVPRPQAFVAQTLSVAAVQLARLVQSGRNVDLEGRIQELDTLGFARRQHPLARRPQCACCGDPAVGRIGGAPTEFRAFSGVKGVENGERSASAAQTLSRYSHLIGPITGIVKELIPSKWNGHTPLLSYSAGNNLAVAPMALSALKQNLRSYSSGKGRSDQQARTSALCKALERYSGKYRGEEITLRGSLRKFGDAGIHPNKLMLYSEKQYRERDTWNARGSQFQVVPYWLEETEITDWTPVWSHSEKRIKYLPASLLFYSYPAQGPRFTSWADSNGCAAGASYEDAVLQGLFELVERDSFAIWWYNRVQRPRVDLTALDDPFISSMQAWFAQMGREFWVLDLTTDLGIPSYVCLNRRTYGPAEDIVMGFGAHLDARTGILRAITEMNQFMPAVLDVGSDGVTHYAFDDPECLHWWRTATLENQPYIQPKSDILSDPSKAQRRQGGAISDLLDEAIAAIEKAGHEVLILDQTRADVGLPVVKVMAPGLRHFWARYAPGRLFEVPLTMGDVTAPLPETALNPIAMFL